jgi:hydroxyacylglutathione hydrolase
MKLFEDFYVYPWTSMEANNTNTIFIDGRVPALVDPGHSHFFNHVIEGMTRDGVSPEKVKLVIGTHGHPDHIEAMEQFDTGVVRAIGKAEYEYLRTEGGEMFLMTGFQSLRKPFTLLLSEGGLTLGKKHFQVLVTPGHSPGGLCLYWPEKRVLLAGDTVFYLGVGRTDMTGGDAGLLARSVERLSRLDVEYLIPGHGEMIKGKRAIQKNFDAVLRQFLA